MQELARKVSRLLHLLQQQLSKRDHYNFSLRSFVVPVLCAAGMLEQAGLVNVQALCSPYRAKAMMRICTGGLRHVDSGAAEAAMLYRAVVDLIRPKVVPDDMPAFTAAMADVFPGMEAQAAASTALRTAVEAVLLEAGLQVWSPRLCSSQEVPACCGHLLHITSPCRSQPTFHCALW